MRKISVIMSTSKDFSNNENNDQKIKISEGKTLPDAQAQGRPIKQTPGPSRVTPARLATSSLEKAQHDRKITDLERYIRTVDAHTAAQQDYQQKLEQDRQELLAYVQKLEQDRLNLLDYNSQLTHHLNNLQNTRTFRAFNRVTSGLKKLQNLPVILKDFWRGALDLPQAGSEISGILQITGWAVSDLAPVTRVEVYLAGSLLGEAKYGLERHDVIAARPWQQLITCGYRGEFKLNSKEFEPGLKTLQIAIIDAKGNRQEFQREVKLVVPALNPAEISDAPLSYEEWIVQNEPTLQNLQQQRARSRQLIYQPLISIITPVYNPPMVVLQAMLDSVRNQTYHNWELCLVDGGSTDPTISQLLTAIASQDNRIHLKLTEQNSGIIGNSKQALELAQGEFYTTLDHDDVLAPDALYEIALALNDNQALDFIYSDHDLLSEDGAKRFDPLFKPDWSPEILLSANYLVHLAVIRATVFQEVGGFQEGLEGVQDLDLFFRVVEKTQRIHHIPRVLYHWRVSAISTASSIYHKPQTPLNQLKAVEAHLKRQGLPEAEAFFDQSGFLRVSWLVTGNPKVSIIIPTKDKPDLIITCVKSVLEKTTYQNFEVVVVDTGSTDPRVFEFYQTLEQVERVKLLDYSQPFNYSAVNNWAVEHCQGEVLLFLNNDTEIIGGDWLEEMLIWAQRPEIGAVGAKLLKPDGTIQHAGVIVGLGGFANHIFAGLPEASNTLFGLTEWYRNYSAVTAACMMIRREVFEAVGGFDEAFRLNGSDVSLCLRLTEAGFRVVYNPFAKLYHLEGATHLGKNIPTDYLLSRESYLPLLEAGDPYFNPNLSYYNLIPSFKKHHEKRPIETVDQFIQQLQQESSQALAAPKAAEIDTYSREATMFAGWLDFSQSLLEESQQVHANYLKALEIKSVTWFLPVFDHAFYGGMHTILRFAAYFHIQKGVSTQFVIVNNYLTSQKAFSMITAPFPELADCKVVVLDTLDDVSKLEPTDAAFSTLWFTAYYLLRYNQTKRKFNFIQDYEPLFYPAGSISAQVQATLRMGFYGITNTVTLKNIYEGYYGGQATSFTPAVNTGLFKPGDRPSPLDKKPPHTVFFYGRPGHPRNGFELGSVALRKVKAQLGDKVRIITAGANWSPLDYGLDGVVENLGLLSYEQTAELYRTCDVGFIMMFTRHPSYLPLELMSSGCLVVTNINPATRWLLESEVNCLLAEASPTILADTIVRGLSDLALRERITKNSVDFIHNHYVNWVSEIEQVWSFMEAPKTRQGVLKEDKDQLETDV